VAQGADLHAGDRLGPHVEELELLGSVPEGLLDDGHRVGPLHLEAVVPADSVGPQRGALVERDGDVLVAGLRVIGDPVEGRRAADEVVALLVEREEDHVADHVAGRRTRDELLGLAGGEVGEGVDAQPGEERQRAGALHHQLGHVVALVVEHARLLPGDLLVAPVRELGRHPRIDVRPGLCVAQQLDGVVSRSEQLFQTAVSHGDPPLEYSES
jgi:hypothetical protein